VIVGCMLVHRFWRVLVWQSHRLVRYEAGWRCFVVGGRLFG
jgi:hypothetical protein